MHMYKIYVRTYIYLLPSILMEVKKKVPPINWFPGSSKKFSFISLKGPQFDPLKTSTGWDSCNITRPRVGNTKKPPSNVSWIAARKHI